MNLSPSELNAFVDCIAEAVASKLASTPLLIDRYALAKALSVSVPSIERLQAAGEIPVVRIGRRCLYDPVEVVAALSAKTRSADSTEDVRAEHRVKKAAGQP